MSKIRSYIMAGALAFATVVPVTMAEAGPMAPATITVEKSSDVTQVRCGRWGCNGRWNGRGRYYGRGRYWGPRYYGARRYWGPRRVWVAPVIIAPRVVVRRGYNAHVNWCLSRYGSYNPRTNTFLSYDGYYKRCVSPY